MIVVLQRVKSAEVTVNGSVTGSCGRGLLILLGVAEGDSTADADALAAKISKLRIFEDENGKMNRSCRFKLHAACRLPSRQQTELYRCGGAR